MAEKQNQFSANDEYLIAEYKKHNSKAIQTLTIAGKTFVVPYKYTIGAQTPDEAKEKFQNALFDFQQQEKEKYHQAKDVPLTIDVDGFEYVVPFGTTGTPTIENITQQILDKAENKYNAVINAHRQLKEKQPADFSSAAAEKYVYRLAKTNRTAGVSPKTPELMEVLDFLRLCTKIGVLATGYVAQKAYKGGKKAAKYTYQQSKKGVDEIKQNSAFKQFKTSTAGLTRGIVKKIVAEEKKYFPKGVPNSYKAGMAAFLISVGGAWGVSQCFSDKEQAAPAAQSVPQQPKIYTPEIPAGETADTYIDFRGMAHSDKYGNLKRMRELRPEIMTIILAIEGYTETSFNDEPNNKGTETVGSGATVIIDEQGREIPVKKGDRLTPEQDVINNTRYIDKHLLSVLGDNIGHSLTDREILTIIGAGYCWGTNGVTSSKFLQSIKDNEPLQTQMRKLSGFRKQKGLLKRSALLAQCLCGNWTANDLLDMPIYYIKDKGYVHCSIYTKDLSYYLPCEKKADGSYKIDENGNQIPIICADDFCEPFYLDKNYKMLSELKKESLGKKHTTVRDFLPEEYLNSLLTYKNYLRLIIDENKNFSTFKLPNLQR